jgi:probable HAF family extracellular repeat protein
VGLHQCPSERKGEGGPVRSLPVPSHVPSHRQTPAKVRGFSPTAPRYTGETDWLLEEAGFEPSVPLHILTVSDPLLVGPVTVPFAKRNHPFATGYQAFIGTQPFGINDAMVGAFSDSTGGHGFLDIAGSFTTIDVPGAGFTSAQGINDAGQIVGFFESSFAVDHGFLATPVPEPSGLAILGVGLIALVILRRQTARYQS